MFTIGVQQMGRGEKQVYALLKSSAKPLTIQEMMLQTDYSQRGLLRVLSCLRKQRLIRGTREGRYTLYEPIS
jgi:DNA-binding transcriptional regulator GbsR (MarR family)